MKSIRTEQWIAWIAAMVTAAVGAMAFAYSTFETKDHANETKRDTTDRLVSIENKVDKLDNKIDKLVDKMITD